MIEVPPNPWLRREGEDIIELIFPARAEDDEVEACMVAIREFWTGVNQRIGWLTNMEHVLAASPKQRKLVAENEKLTAPHSAKWLRGNAFYGGGAITRGMITAVFWIQPPRYKHQLFGKREEALRWLATLT